MRGHLRLRDFARADQEQVRTLVLAGLAGHWGSIDEALNGDLHDIAEFYGAGRTVVVEDQDRIVGTGTLMPRTADTAEIVRMSVDAGERRQGVGRWIVEALLDTAGAWGKTTVVLETSAHWDEVVAFYVSCGFRVTHQTDGEFGRDTWFELRVDAGRGTLA
jgi:GNAT superfamily N-acetyltransferase